MVAFEKVMENQPQSQKPVKITDESIINELFKLGRTENIGRSTFKDLGIKAQLGWETVIVKYPITRTSVFKYLYEIERI